jgi:hypothetical protein
MGWMADGLQMITACVWPLAVTWEDFGRQHQGRITILRMSRGARDA